MVGVIAHYVLFKILERISRRFKNLPADSLARHCGAVTRWLIIILAVRLVLPATAMPEQFAEPLGASSCAGDDCAVFGRLLLN